MQTYDPRIYAVGECVAHRGIAYGLVAPLFEQAKVCANHLANFGIGALQGLGDLDQAQGHRHRRVFRRQLHRRRTGHRRDRAARPVGRRVQEAGGEERHPGRRRALRRHGRRRLVLPAGQGRPEHPRNARPPDVRPEPSGRRRPCKGQTKAASMPDDGRGVRLQRRVQGHHRQGDQGARACFSLDDVRKHTKASSSCGSCTGLVEQILASTIGGAYTPAGAPGQADVRLHRPFARRGARAIRERHLLDHPDT
jgi:nitrite reductase (NADH) large subunit